MSDELNEFIKKAIQREESSYQLYQKVGKETKFASARELFDMLAKEELKHKAMLENIDLEKLKAQTLNLHLDAGWDEEIQLTPLHELGVVEEVLNFAIRKEREAIANYTKMAENLREGKAKELFIWLANEEKKHKEILTRELKKFRSSVV